MAVATAKVSAVARLFETYAVDVAAVIAACALIVVIHAIGVRLWPR